MTERRSLYRALAVLWVCLPPLGAAAQEQPPSIQDLPASQGEAWTRSIAGFETAVSAQARALADNRRRQERLGSEIAALETKTAALRDQASGNLFDQLRLKKLLAELQGKLEAQAALKQDRDARLADFEQKGLSLLSLYNESISRQLDLPEGSEPGDRLDSVIATVRKRQALQGLLDRFPGAPDDQRMAPLSLLDQSGGRDLASLKTTLDILQDREKELQTRIEKADVRAAELNQEITLQGKMRDFLSDMRKMNEASSFPRESLNRADLQALESQAQDSNLKRGIQAAQKRQDQDRADLEQVRRYIRSVQARIQEWKGGGSR
ncbi:MAG TPA: hypothetical protein VFR02_10395 [bacterium]|nr:hypothetical protein [bacterium]